MANFVPSHCIEVTELPMDLDRSPNPAQEQDRPDHERGQDHGGLLLAQQRRPRLPPGRRIQEEAVQGAKEEKR